MLAKLIVFGSDRARAVARLTQALDAFAIDGVRTNLPLLRWIARDEAFRAGDTTTAFLSERLDESMFARRDLPREAAVLAIAATLLDGAAPWRIGGVGMPIRLQSEDGALAVDADATGAPDRWVLSGDLHGELHAERHGDRLRATLGEMHVEGTAARERDGVTIGHGDAHYALRPATPPSAVGGTGAQGGAAGTIVAPMPGKIVKVAVVPGDEVAERALLIVLEAMKMEHRLEASAASSVKRVLVKEGDVVSGGTPLVELA